MKKRIALLYGGVSSEHEVSLMGYEYVSELLKETEYDILPVYIDKSGDWFLGGKGGIRAQLSSNLHGSLYTNAEFIKIDAAIPLLHGMGGEDGSVQGALSAAGIAYVGADVCTSAVCIDKSYTKSVVASLGIPTVREVSFSSPKDTEVALTMCKKKIGFPMFIKPRRLGSSVGAYPVYDEDGFRRCFPLSMSLGENLVIVERLMEKKRELECAFCEIDGEKIITPPGEILIDGFYGYDEKYGGRTKALARADTDKKTAEKALEYSFAIADALSLRHLARIDFFLSDGDVIFNEVNTFPGFTGESLYPKMLEAFGIRPRDALLSFIRDALS